MKIVSVTGGLGNQMFAYAAYLALKQRYPFIPVLLELTEIWNEHNGKEIIKVFSHLKWHSHRHYRRVQKIYSEYYTKRIFSFKTETECNYGTYDKEFFRMCPVFCRYCGYWQSEKYFKKVAKAVRNAFHFDIAKLNSQSLALAEIIKKDDTAVSVHIRKGDYSKYSDIFCDIFAEGYYDRAIAEIKRKTPSAHFYYFSDDTAFVKTHFLLNENDIVVDWNKGDDCWQDMYLMSICKHNIIANSTFSWWGAWLNENQAKTVIAPQKWFVKYKAEDILPESWIRH